MQIDQASIYRTALGNNEVASATGRVTEQNVNGNLTAAGNGTLQNPASIAADGVYIVKAIDYTGETRGQPWYMDLMCFARGERAMISQQALLKMAGGGIA